MTVSTAEHNYLEYLFEFTLKLHYVIFDLKI